MRDSVRQLHSSDQSRARKEAVLSSDQSRVPHPRYCEGGGRIANTSKRQNVKTSKRRNVETSKHQNEDAHPYEPQAQARGSFAPRIRVHRLSDLGRIALLCVFSLSLSGCITPIGASSSSSKTGTRSNSKSRGAHAASTSSAKRTEPPSIDRIKVGTETLRAAELWNGLGDELSTQSKALPDSEFRRFLEQRAAQLLADRIAEMLLYQKASARLGGNSEKGIDRFVDAEIRKTVTEDYGGVQRRYEKELESRGTTLDDAREKLRREIIIAGFLEAEIKPKIGEPTRDELQLAFDAERDSLRKKERRAMSLITVRVLDELPKSVVEPTREELANARDRARAKMRTVLDELRAGGDFADLARRYSSDLHAADGGAWGWVSKGSVRERFEPAVDALYAQRATEVSDIVETPDDFFLVRCGEIDAGNEPTFESSQPELKSRHVRKAQNKLIGELIIELRALAHIEITDLENLHAAAITTALRVVGRTDPASPPSAAAILP